LGDLAMRPGGVFDVGGVVKTNAAGAAVVDLTE
jgi:hypothetical protein